MRRNPHCLRPSVTHRLAASSALHVSTASTLAASSGKAKNALNQLRQTPDSALPRPTAIATGCDAATRLRRLGRPTTGGLCRSFRTILLALVLLPLRFDLKFFTVRVVTELLIAVLHNRSPQK